MNKKRKTGCLTICLPRKDTLLIEFDGKSFEIERSIYLSREWLHSLITQCPEFQTFSEISKHDMMCSAYALSEYIMRVHDELNTSLQRDDVFTWLLFMSCIYVHNWIADMPYDTKTYADPLRKKIKTLSQEFFIFCDLVFNLPMLTMKTRNRVSGNKGDVFTGNVVKMMPFMVFE
jgi:hypothetical protein